LFSLFCNSSSAFVITDAVFTSEEPEEYCQRPPEKWTYNESISKVHAWIDYSAFAGGKSYYFEWYSPNDILAQIKTGLRSSYSDGCSWRSISIGKLREFIPGRWVVRFYYDNRYFWTGIFRYDPDQNPPIHNDKIYSTPDFLQTDSSYGGIPGGQNYCGPVSVSNSLIWLDDNDFNNLVGNTNDRKRDQYNLIIKLGSSEYMDASEGTSVNRLLEGVKTYVIDKGYAFHTIKYQGWKYHYSEYSTMNDKPDLNWIRNAIDGNGVAWLNIGWYTYNNYTNTYTRIGGHWVTLVGYGHNGYSDSNPNYLIIHDPASRADKYGACFSNEYILPVRIFNGTLEGDEYGLPKSANGYYKLTDGMHINSSADFAILDGAVAARIDLPGNIDNDGDGYSFNNGDCDDADDTVYPGAEEICEDNIDQDCNGSDLACPKTWFRDFDNDGFGNSNVFTVSTIQPSGYVANNTDCNDFDELINPGADENCNMKDDNCNSYIDEGIPRNAYYLDIDGDGFGDPNEELWDCSQPSGHVDNNSDYCPYDAFKIIPGICGCGESDIDSDGEPDCIDGCKTDPDKSEPGTCGCGVADTDSDYDGTPDCNDSCDADPNKIEPGICGCGVVDDNNDTDRDGVFDCNDECDNDPDKTEPGLCGCGIVDIDTDSDGTPDCMDPCANDPNKVQPDICGCGVTDIDTDGDGSMDCNDNCPNDQHKVNPGACGCGVPDLDTDSDEIFNCNDLDDDNDEILDDQDAFPLDANEWSDFDRDGTGDNSDTDDDNDGINDITESEGPNSGDSNNDGIADSLQANVSSLESNNSQGYVTIESPEGTAISGCEVADNPSLYDTPVGIAFDYDLFDFTINDVTAGGSAEVTITLPYGGTIPDTYYKYGITPDNQTDHWYEFLYDGETGAEINGNVITLHFIDALRGDDILIQDSMIVDKGGPGFFTPVVTITFPVSNLNITAGESLNFECSVISGNEPLAYSWNFGGGATNSTQRAPENVTFQTAGTYTVTLTVTDVNSDTDSDTVTIYVDTPPTDNDRNGDDGGGGGGGGCFIDNL